MANYPRYAIYYTAAPGSALDRFGASLLGYDAYARRRPALSRWAAIGLARPDAGSPQIRLSRHAEGADGAGRRQGRSAACRGMRIVRRSGPARASDPTGRQFDQRFHRGDSGRAVGRARTACRRGDQSIRSVPRPAQPRRSCAAKARQADAATARLSRPLGLPLRVRRISLPHDADGTACPQNGAIRLSRCCETDLPRSISPRWRSTGSRYSVRTKRHPDSGSSDTGRCVPAAEHSMRAGQAVTPAFRHPSPAR